MQSTSTSTIAMAILLAMLPWLPSMSQAATETTEVVVPGLGKVQVPAKLGRFFQAKKSQEPAPSSSPPDLPPTATGAPAQVPPSAAITKTTSRPPPPTPAPAAPTLEARTTSDFIVVAGAVGMNWKGEISADAHFQYHLTKCSEEQLCIENLKQIAPKLKVPLAEIITHKVTLVPQRTSQDMYGQRTTVNLPIGYAYCTSETRVMGISPGDAVNGSTFFVQARDTGAYAEVWLKPYAFDEAKSSVQAVISVVGVKQALAESSYANGTCHRPAVRVIQSCRGSKCLHPYDAGQSLPPLQPASLWQKG
jgi:hypothetical protein